MNVNVNYKPTQSQNVQADCSINPNPTNQVALEQIKCVSPVTFSQKLYQSHALEIAEELEQAINANSLEKIKNLLDKVLETNKDSVAS